APLRRSDGDDARTGGGPSPRRGAVVYDIGSDNDDPLEMELEPDSDAEADAPPPPPNLVYIERVAELEQRSDGLRRELAAAHEDERALRAGIHDKNQLVAHLARKAELSGNRSAAAHAGDAPARGGGRSREESTAELENASSRKRRRRTSGSEMTSRTGARGRVPTGLVERAVMPAPRPRAPRGHTRAFRISRSDVGLEAGLWSYYIRTVSLHRPLRGDIRIAGAM
ncbi:unnamed protein product, partial [Prorocentrum cordatum]